MDNAAIDRVLACRTLPSLPAVALEVLDLTRDPKVPIEKIAKLVQNDPALTTKILRTVNSSYYGLTHPCPTISRAVSLLGLNTVKSLVLGFSLVEMTGKSGRGFDLVAYWRRAIYSAAGARLLARRTRVCDPEEAFIAALLQDVGMLAAHSALGEEYDKVLESAPEDHEQLAALETRSFGFDHAEIGSRLAEKWKLPPQVVECTRRHHKPDASDQPQGGLLRLVSLGADVAAALTLSTARLKLTRFMGRAAEWFGIKKEESEQMLHEVSEGASQLSSLLEIKTGITADVASILAEANEQLALHQIEVQHEASELQKSNQELTRQVITDALTGVANRKHFDAQIAAEFGSARQTGAPLAVLFGDIDHFKSVNDKHGHQAGDTVLVEVARRLRETAGATATVCRYGGEEFAIIMPGADAARATDLAENLRRAVEAAPVDLRALKVPAAELRVSMSIGVATTAAQPFLSHETLVRAADEAVYVAKKAGRNCVRLAASTKTAVPASSAIPTGHPPAASPGGGPGEITVLLVEDDALAAKLVELMFAKRPEARIIMARSAEDAMRVLYSGVEGRAVSPSVILCDLNLPGMQGVGFIRAVRSDPRWTQVPIVAMSASIGEQDADECRQAGASEFLTKTQFCANFGRWISRFIELGRGCQRAA